MDIVNLGGRVIFQIFGKTDEVCGRNDENVGMTGQFLGYRC